VQAGQPSLKIAGLAGLRLPCLSGLVVLLSLPAWATSDPLPTLKPSIPAKNSRQSARLTQSTAGPASELLSAEGLRMAQTIGIEEKLKQLKSINQPLQSDGETLRALVIKSAITEAIVSESFEVRSCMSNLETEIAQADDLQAFLEERRDRVIRLNTIANFLSGGITGIVGGALKLGNASEQGANGIDTGEGITQTTLALWALKQQVGEKKIVEGTPNMLAKVFDLDCQHSERDYPPSVWRYLCSVPESSQTGLTRQQELLKRWKKLKVISDKKQNVSSKEVVGHITGTDPRSIVTIDLLDARSAMLHDVRALVAEMDHPLLELMQAVKTVKLE